MLSTDILSILMTGPVAVFIVYLLLLLSVGLRTGSEEEAQTPLKDYPRVSILIAAKDEAQVLPYTLRSILKLRYPRDMLETILAIDEGDLKTFKACSEFTKEVNVLWVKGSQGKPSALRQALPNLNGELILLLDSDSILDEGALEKLIAYLKAYNLTAVTGIPYPINISEGWLPKMFALECKLWELLASAKNKLGLFIHAGGLLSLVKRSAIEDAGGWHEGSLAEDIDLSIRISSLGYRVGVAPVKVFVEAPAKLKTFLKQRVRWYKGVLEVFTHRLGYIFRLKALKRLDAIVTFLSPMGAVLFLPIILGAIVFGGTLRFMVAVASILCICSAIMATKGFPLRLRALICFTLPIYFFLYSIASWAALILLVLPIRLKWERTEKTGLYLKQHMKLSTFSKIRGDGVELSSR